MHVMVRAICQFRLTTKIFFYVFNNRQDKDQSFKWSLQNFQDFLQLQMQISACKIITDGVSSKMTLNLFKQLISFKQRPKFSFLDVKIFIKFELILLHSEKQCIYYGNLTDAISWNIFPEEMVKCIRPTAVPGIPFCT